MNQDLPLNDEGIEALYKELVSEHNPNCTYLDVFKIGYNQGCINTAKYVGNQDQLCWQNGYDEAKRDADMEAGFSHDAGMDSARRGVQDVMQPEESNLDFFLGDGEKPVCRIQWFHDPGDRHVGIYPRCGWVLADDQSGTELETLLVKAGLVEKPEVTPSGEPVVVHIPPTLTADPRGFPNRERYFSHKSGNFNDDANPVVCVAGIYESEYRAWWVNADGSRDTSYILNAAYIERHLALGNIIEHPTLEAAIAASKAVLEPPIPAPQPAPENAATGLDLSRNEQPWIHIDDDYMRCPLFDGDLEVEVKFRNGHLGVEKAKDWLWDMEPDNDLRIVAYRVPAWKEIEANTLVSPEMDGRSKRLEAALRECLTVVDARRWNLGLAYDRFEEINRVVRQALDE